MNGAMTARDVAGMVGGLDLDVLRAHHGGLAAVTAELAVDARMDWPCTADDPTVALLRALARIAIDAPEATSRQASRLHERFAGSCPAPAHGSGTSPTIGAPA